MVVSGGVKDGSGLAPATRPRGADRLRALDLMLAAVALLPLLLFGAVAAYDRALTLEAAERNLLATLDTLHAHAERVLDLQALAIGVVDLRLRGLDEAEILADEPALHRYLQDLRLYSGGYLGLVVFGADGRPLVDPDRLPAPRDVDVADRPYFRWHREHAGPEPFVAPPVASRASGGAATFFVTMRRTPPAGDVAGGAFAGVIAAGIRQSAFVEHWDRAAPDPNASIVLVRDDGTALVRRPPLDPNAEYRFPPNSPLMRLVSDGAERRVVSGVSPVDGVERLLAYRRIERFPVSIAHGVSWDEALAPWRGRLAFYGVAAAAASLALASIALLARRRAWALAREAAERRQAEAEVRALNAGLEGRVAERTADIQASEARLRTAIAQAPFPIALHAEDGEILQANAAWQGLSGWRWPEDFRTVAEWTDRAHAARGAEVRSGIDGLYGLTDPVDEGEFRIRTAAGAERVWSFGSAPIGRDARGRRLVVSMAADLTELRRAEAEVRELNRDLERRVEDRTRRLAEANAELDAFAHSVAHDLRAPLRTMQGFGQALLEDHAGALDAEGHDHLGRIVRGAAQLDDLIQDLLAYSRLARQDVPLEPVPLDRVVDQALARFEGAVAERRAVVEVDVASLPAVTGHAVVLSQVVGNLVSNALKFVAPDARPRLRIRGESIGRRVRVWVEDDGIGIAPEHQGRIFEVFQRLHGPRAYEGTGIGLAIVRKGVERLGGRVGVLSEPGRGSRFWFELDRHDGPAPDGPPGGVAARQEEAG
jgi:PAS domain S-box-containing protein